MNSTYMWLTVGVLLFLSDLYDTAKLTKAVIVSKKNGTIERDLIVDLVLALLTLLGMGAVLIIFIARLH